MGPIASRFTCCVLVASFVLPCQLRTGVHCLAAQEAAPVRLDAAGTVAGPAAAARMERILEAAAAIARELPRDRFEVQGVLDLVGREPVKLLAWVAESTEWVPYEGALRGAIGVLMDRMGNSLDRAILLAELLRAAGHRVRLATARLADVQAQAIHEKAALGERRPADAAPRAPGPALAGAIAQLPEIAAWRRAVQLESERAAEDAVQRAAIDAAELTAALGSSRAPGDAGSDAKAIEAARDHWWVQVAAGDAWQDLDPLADVLGAARPPPAETVAIPNQPTGKLPVDGARCHELEVRVVIERWKGGRREEATALARAFRPAEHPGERIVLSFLPLNWPKDIPAVARDAKEAERGTERLKAAAAKEREWLPVLRLGPDLVTQSSFTDAGEINKSPAPGAGSAGGLAQGVGGLGGRVALGLGGKRDKPQSVLTAVWIEYETRVPGRPTSAVRRDVLDLVGPASRAAAAAAAPEPSVDDAAKLRRGLALLERTEILPVFCRLAPEYVENLMAHGLAASRGFLLDLARGVAAGDGSDAGALAARPGELYNLAIARFAWGRHTGDLHVAEPNVFTSRTRIGVDAAGQLTGAHGFDIVTNRLAVRPGTRVDPFMAFLDQGVIETCAEAVLNVKLGPVRSLSLLCGAAREQGIGLVALRGPDDAGWGEVEMPAGMRQRIEADLKLGYVAVVPRKPVELAGLRTSGWWRVHAATGETLGRMENGEGQSTTEYLIQQAVLALPGALASALSYYCNRQQRTDGMCSPCLIAFLGLIGMLLGLANGVSSWVQGDKGSLGFVFGLGTGTYGFATKILGCVDHVINKYGHGK